MVLKRLAKIGFGVAWLFVLGASPAKAVLIDFEDLAMGDEVTTQYSHLGVVFGSPGAGLPKITLHGSTGSTLNNVLFDQSRDLAHPFEIYALFAAGITEVSVDVYVAVNHTLTMTAFDSSGLVIGEATSAPSADWQAPFSLSLSGIGLISSLTFVSSAPNAAAPYIDNLSFSPTSVPEPATLALFGVALAGLAFRRRMAR